MDSKLFLALLMMIVATSFAYEKEENTFSNGQLLISS